MTSINVGLRNGLLVLTAALGSFVQPGAALADSPQRCVTLEHSNLTNKQLKPSGNSPYQYYSLALSRDRQLIALYQDFNPKKLTTFKLWDSKTGKLQKSRTMTNYRDSSLQGRLNFSPDNSLVYYSGMGPGVPFWNLNTNEMVLSPCRTAMGITKVGFSEDMTVAYTSTVDDFRSLCRTDKAELLASIAYAHGDFSFDKKTKHLHGTFAPTDEKSYQFDQQKIDGLTADDKQHISITLAQPAPQLPESDNSPASSLTSSLSAPKSKTKSTPNDDLLLNFYPWPDTEWHLSKDPKFFYDQKKKKIRFCRLFD